LAIDAAAVIGIQPDAGVIGAAGDAARIPGLKLRDAAKLPSAEHFSNEVGLAPEEWELVEVIRNEHVARIELGGPVQIVGVVGVGDYVALVGSIVRALRKRIGDAEKESVGKPPVPTDLQRVVSRTSDVVGFPNRVIAQIRPQ